MRKFLLLLILLLPVSKSPIQFEDVTQKSGLLNAVAGMMGHSAAWGDLDQDGFPDLFIGGFCDRPNHEYLPAKGPVPSKLFRNLANGTFQEIKNTPTAFYGRLSGALFVDLNDDGYPELYASNNAKAISNLNEEPQKSAQTLQSKLFLNRNKSLVEITNESGASPAGLQTARTVSALDFNSDGLIDLFVVEDKFNKRKQGKSILLKNTGNSRFRVANDEANLPNDIHGLGAAVADLNEDGKPDIFVAHSNRFFLSQPGNKYREAVELDHVFQWNPSDSEDWPCGAAFGDLNLDGNLDLVLTIHHEPSRNKIFLNKGIVKGVPVFEDVTAAAGFPASVPVKSPHVEIQDFDNDGLPDIYTTAAFKEGNQVLPLIYQNNGISSSKIPNFLPVREVKSPMLYYPAGPTADFDRDGKLDILLVNWFQGDSAHLLKNTTISGNWLQIEAPVGTKIKLYSGNKLVGYQQIYPSFGFSSGQLPVGHFGLNHLSSVDLDLRLPNGINKTIKNLSVNRRIKVLKSGDLK